MNVQPFNVSFRQGRCYHGLQLIHDPNWKNRLVVPIRKQHHVICFHTFLLDPLCRLSHKEKDQRHLINKSITYLSETPTRLCLHFRRRGICHETSKIVYQLNAGSTAPQHLLSLNLCNMRYIIRLLSKPRWLKMFTRLILVKSIVDKCQKSSKTSTVHLQGIEFEKL